MAHKGRQKRSGCDWPSSLPVRSSPPASPIPTTAVSFAASLGAFLHLSQHGSRVEAGAALQTSGAQPRAAVWNYLFLPLHFVPTLPIILLSQGLATASSTGSMEEPDSSPANPNGNIQAYRDTNALHSHYKAANVDYNHTGNTEHRRPRSRQEIVEVHTGLHDLPFLPLGPHPIPPHRSSAKTASLAGRLREWETSPVPHRVAAQMAHPLSSGGQRP